MEISVRKAGYVVMYVTAAAICFFALPDIWREAHGFWDTVICLGLFFLVLGISLGVALYIIDFCAAIGAGAARLFGSGDDRRY